MPIYIGTAGYVYPHWRKGAFYPNGLKQASELSHYLTNYPTVEINATFHAFPRLSTLIKWRQQSPPNTVFALKAPAQITHTKRLKNVTEDIISFCKIATEGLESNLGPLLFQCPPSLLFSLALLKSFLNDITEARQQLNVDFRVAIEFRSKDWFCQSVLELLAEYDVALVNNIVVCDNDFSKINNQHFPNIRHMVINKKPKWIYNRFHGSKNPEIFTDFPDEILEKFAKENCERMKDDKDFVEYSYFLNDWNAIAPRNAKRYTEIYAKTKGIRVCDLVNGFVPEWSRQKRSIKSFFSSKEDVLKDDNEKKKFIKGTSLGIVKKKNKKGKSSNRNGDITSFFAASKDK